MKLYSCKIRLAGSLYNEVPRIGVTAPEVAILKVLHGDDAIVDLRETGKNKTSHSEERDRLVEAYGGGLMAQQLGKTPEMAFAAVFGVGGKMPDDIPGTPKAASAEKAAAPAVEDTEPESLEA